MATRFYLPASGTTSPLPNLGIHMNWEAANTFHRGLLSTAKQNTSLTTRTATITGDDCFAQLVSTTLASAYDFTTSDTLTGMIQAAEGQTDNNAGCYVIFYVTSADGATVRGTKVFSGGGFEFPTTLGVVTLASATFSAISAQAGDRIVVEFGTRGTTGSGHQTSLRFGDPSAVADISSTEDYCPWIEISPTLSFTSSATPISLFRTKFMNKGVI